MIHDHLNPYILSTSSSGHSTTKLFWFNKYIGMTNHEIESNPQETIITSSISRKVFSSAWGV